jgi:heme exporter protein A
MSSIENLPGYVNGSGQTASTAAHMRLVGEDLACTRGGREIFAGLNFSVEGGQGLIVSGPNGVGKTSLLRIAAGLLAAANGRIVLENGDPEQTVSEQAHYLAHRDALKSSLSVLENLRFWTEYLGNAAMQLRGALEAVELERLAHFPAGYLSAGQRRRLSIARLIAVRRSIWLLDEPTAALDTAGEARLAELMQAHLASGGIVVAATHGPLRLEPACELKLGRPS